MKKQNFLFEILTEELPPKALAKLEKALAENIIEQLKQAELGFSAYQSFATPRRLALIIQDLAFEQPTREIERKGPAVSAAYDAQGNPTKAALGFAESCGVNLKQVEILKTDKGEWLSYKSLHAGKSINALLPSIIQLALTKLPIPKMMKWGEGLYDFIRPVHNIVLLYGKEIIPAEFFGLKASNKTYGHRFHHPEAITVTADNYLKQLHKAYVIADYTQRKDLIRQQVQ